MINQVKLFQFKAFKDQIFNFSNLTLLTGVNGMGKSSLIQALLVLRNSYDRGDLQHGQVLTIEDEELVDLVSADAMLNADADNSNVSIHLRDDEAEAEWKVIAEGPSNSLPLVEHTIRAEIFESALFHSTFQYLNAERIGPRKYYDRLSVRRRHSELGYKGEYTAAKLSKITVDNEKIIHSSLAFSGDKFIYQQVSSWLSKILHPDTRISLDENISSRISIQYTFARQNGKSHNPLNIGFGFSFALPVIVAVLTAPKNSLLIIENPEAHLHPKGQAEMGKFLALAAESGIQIIIETHSDHILNGIRVAIKQKEVSKDSINVTFVGTYDDDGHEKIYVTEPTINNDGRIEDWPKDFFDTWEYSMMNLL